MARVFDTVPALALGSLLFAGACFSSYGLPDGTPDAALAETGVDSAPDFADAEVDADPCELVVGVGCEVVVDGYLKASNTGSGDLFGVSLARDGNTRAVGARLEGSSAMGVNPDGQFSNSAPESGAVYVFVRSGDAWSQQAYIKASNTDARDEFGTSVALDGDTLVVGATGEASRAMGVNPPTTSNITGELSNRLSTSGAVYVYQRTGNRWTQEAYIKASDPGAGDEFGRSVAIDGGTLAVGAHLAGAGGRGAAHVFTRAGRTWREQAVLSAADGDFSDRFGESIALDGDTLVVGAPEEDSSVGGINPRARDERARNAGAVYVFVRSGSSWTEQAYIKASNPDGADIFGQLVALNGDTLVVSAYFERSDATGVNPARGQANNSADGAGAVYVFVRSRGAWSQQAYIKASNTEGDDQFGRAIALEGDTLAVGAVGEDGDSTDVNGDEDNNDAENAG
ncbi:MAG: integrin, partial [Myxococcota bacterium]